ncbi:hypothetical protein COCSUDRAFT_60006 [Coccomyxa subellipsoidea C-169]|uniref:BTB domain-containing protein n=1 Tax=Coccomyxa subellipsoidea (strain C-169) TaxID=574566 RepID=I0YJX8_COCSC|nr:hypothetical protein COCSUDRAFT_60006 [Coccomyxa subellipsoidea C-169]EIE18697.1 hypothetical protein COCSUDRAFT_60006 [Coccomyxa subellipsoidea C-169]|eukprot:XP_005643241.1 hypothetical protein COCSUDRAFT_60006 [Coccomyxa subellipsoidea C-169]
MLEAHFAGDSQKNGPAAIPLPDCSLQEAEAFLCYLYHLPTDVQLNPDSARAIVKLAHKFDVGTALQQCDEFLAHHMKQMPLWDCGRDALEWALFAQQYHLPLLEAEAVHHIVQNFVEAERQEGFNELGQGDQTDVLLVLDTKEELPAHALYLSANSSVFSGMLEEQLTSTAKDKLPVKIPLPDCSLQEAKTFLCYLYRKDAQLTSDSAKYIVKLAHKFDMGVDSNKEILKLALFAHQYHLEKSEEKAVQSIAERLSDMDALEDFDKLNLQLLRRITKVVARKKYY